MSEILEHQKKYETLNLEKGKLREKRKKELIREF